MYAEYTQQQLTFFVCLITLTKPMLPLTLIFRTVLKTPSYKPNLANLGKFIFNFQIIKII